MRPAALAWLIVGFSGQALFSLRFLTQWLQSERLRRSVVPVAFWYFSLFGGVILLAYAIHRQDPVFIVGQATGILIYARNLQLIRQERCTAAAGRPGPGVAA
ncbi:MAG TPA: lipid-A-disaccharide synthase N-terminal domain-containing protein [Thermoanaerobaculia bacterium]|nr:lipid-A-disaccharide synthase N-terminal domain-containing protein [Thermoanaerobaculia bacterium]